MNIGRLSKTTRLLVLVYVIIITTTSFFVTYSPTRAATLTVNTLEDLNTDSCASTCSLRDAIAVAASGDSIDFQDGLAGTITLTQGELSISDKNVNIVGPGANKLTISGNLTSRVFRGARTALSISNLTIAQGKVFNDFGVNVLVEHQASLTLDNVVVKEGDGVSAITVSDLTNLTIRNSLITNNQANGAYLNGGVLLIENTTISYNTAQVGGGVIVQGGDATISRSTIHNNTAQGQSGGIHFDGNSLNISNSTIANNTSPAYGGLYFRADSASTLINTTFAYNDTPTNNGSDNLYAATANLGLKNSIVVSNAGNVNCNPGMVSDLGNNLQYPDQSCGSSIPVGDPKLAPLADNGGPTWTMALQLGSAATDNGDNAICAAAPINNIDQRGFARPFDGDGNGSAVCDIGAFEAPRIPTPTATRTPRPPRRTSTPTPTLTPAFLVPTNTPPAS